MTFKFLSRFEFQFVSAHFEFRFYSVLQKLLQFFHFCSFSFLFCRRNLTCNLTRIFSFCTTVPIIFFLILCFCCTVKAFWFSFNIFICSEFVTVCFLLFCSFLYHNICTAIFPVSIVFKNFEDCSFSISVVLKYLFLYSNIFHFCTAILHSNYLLHIYIQIFVTEMALPSTPVNSIPNHGEKPERFNGTNFKRWKQKMFFYLTTLNLARFLNEDGPKLDVGETDKEKLATVDAWNHSDFLCRNYVLNGLENTLYNVYSPLKMAKDLWDSLDKKYKTEEIHCR